MARALRAWAINRREKLGPYFTVRTSNSINKRYLLEECRSRYAKFRIHQYEHKPRLIQTQVFLPAWSCGKTLAGTGEIGRIVYPIEE